MLAFTLIPAGLLLAIPAYAPVGLALALGFCVEMNLQTSYTADLATIINTNSAFVLGGLAGLVVTRLMRVIGTQASARRLMRATYRDLADLAAGRELPSRDQWASRMLDRVGLLLYRQPRFEPRPPARIRRRARRSAARRQYHRDAIHRAQHVGASTRGVGGDVCRARCAFPRPGARPAATAWRRFITKDRYGDRRSSSLHCSHPRLCCCDCRLATDALP